ncbi:MAG TPA: hypothetical protein VLT87_08065 [Thermoanaerobaculia bacterium]|nr:hypothetical protein [Thermoanaerobaculia bacterium]
MTQKKTIDRKAKPAAPTSRLTSRRLEELLEEGRRMRRIVHERLEKARSVGEDAMRFRVR